MVARTHDTAAAVSLLTIFLLIAPRSLSLATVILAVLANLIGGIAPDLDQPTAPFWRNLPIGKYFGRVFGVLTGGHRFLSHSLIGLALFVFSFHWLLVFLQPVMTSVDIGYVTWAFAIGMVSHLIMDSFTKEGVPWLLPIPFKFGFPPLRRLRITTGTWIEAALVFPALIALLLWISFANYEQLVLFLHTITSQ
jgi:inner membrane protein